MKRSTLLILAVSSAFVFQGCGGNKDSTKTADSTNAVKDSSTKDTAGRMSISVEKGDAKFAVEAASGGMTEVALGKLAQEKGESTKVKNFGAMMVTDHTKANMELMGLAKTKSITLPTVPGADDQKVIDKLSKLSGKDFDKAYVSDMIDDHKHDIKVFQDAAKNCSDADIKGFASKTLPTLQNHLDAINTIHGSMK